MDKILSYISITRPLNSFIACLGIFTAALIAGGTSDAFFAMLFAALGGLCITAAGNIMNDLHDIDIDRINQPQRVLASSRLTTREALAWCNCCILVGLILCWFVSMTMFIIAVGSTIVMYLYSAVFKRIPLLGNIIVGIMTGVVFLFGGYAVGNPKAGIIPAFFACALNIGREILKDIEDIDGDHRGGITTLPILFGVKSSLVIASIFFLTVVFASFIPYIYKVYSVAYMIVVVIGVDCILLYTAYSMWSDSSKSNLHRLATILKYDMLVGMTAIYLGSR